MGKGEGGGWGAREAGEGLKGEVVPGRVKWQDVAALKTYDRVGGPGLEKGEGRVWGHQDTRDVGAER